MRTPDLSRESGNDLPQQNKNQIEKPPHMKKWYKVTIKATITKTQDIHATSQAVAEQEAMELFNPHSGEAEEHYTQEVTSTEEVSEDPETKSILLEAHMKSKITSALFDAYDIRNVLSKGIKNRPKDNEGTEFTIGDCLDDMISTLEELDSKFEE
jgi:hypothetical protein